MAASALCRGIAFVGGASSWRISLELSPRVNVGDGTAVFPSRTCKLGTRREALMGEGEAARGGSTPAGAPRLGVSQAIGGTDWDRGSSSATATPSPTLTPPFASIFSLSRHGHSWRRQEPALGGGPMPGWSRRVGSGAPIHLRFCVDLGLVRSTGHGIIGLLTMAQVATSKFSVRTECYSWVISLFASLLRAQHRVNILGRTKLFNNMMKMAYRRPMESSCGRPDVLWAATPWSLIKNNDKRNLKAAEGTSDDVCRPVGNKMEKKKEMQIQLGV